MHNNSFNSDLRRFAMAREAHQQIRTPLLEFAKIIERCAICRRPVRPNLLQARNPIAKTLPKRLKGSAAQSKEAHHPNFWHEVTHSRKEREILVGDPEIIAREIFILAVGSASCFRCAMPDANLRSVQNAETVVEQLNNQVVALGSVE